MEHFAGLAGDDVEGVVLPVEAGEETDPVPRAVDADEDIQPRQRGADDLGLAADDAEDAGSGIALAEQVFAALQLEAYAAAQHLFLQVLRQAGKPQAACVIEVFRGAHGRCPPRQRFFQRKLAAG